MQVLAQSFSSFRCLYITKVNVQKQVCILFDYISLHDLYEESFNIFEFAFHIKGSRRIPRVFFVIREIVTNQYYHLIVICTARVKRMLIGSLEVT